MARPTPPAVASPLRHISIPVPWHDSGWDGRACQKPAENLSCLSLKYISQQWNDTLESAHSGKSMAVLAECERPCCVGDRGYFMGPFEFTHDR